jgi:hypothetical protein
MEDPSTGKALLSNSRARDRLELKHLAPDLNHLKKYF